MKLRQIEYLTKVVFGACVAACGYAAKKFFKSKNENEGV